MRHLLTLGILGIVVAALQPGDGAEPAAAPVAFTEQLIQSGFGYSYGLAAGDLDGDGRPEITAADADKGELSWFTLAPGGKFTRRFIKQAEPGWFERHVIGDVNGDKKPDVVVVKNLSEELLWFQNPGEPQSGTPWARHVITTKFHRSYDVSLGDLNGDGKPDVAATAWVGNRIAWLLKDQWVRAASVLIVDLDKDGRNDIVASAERGSNELRWWRNEGRKK